MAENKIEIKVNADTTNASTGLSRVQQQLKGFSTSASFTEVSDPSVKEKFDSELEKDTEKAESVADELGNEVKDEGEEKPD